MSERRLLFAAGGTGGHIFPALAVADCCRRLYPDTKIEFVGTRGRLEEKVVPRAGYPLNFLWISGFQRKAALSTLMLPLKIGTSFAQALALLRRFKPHVVVCAGAYVSFPVGIMASLLRIPLVLMESNALPGLTVRKLAPRATMIHTAFEATRQHLPGAPVQISGNPVRGVFFQHHDQAAARRHFGLDPERPTIFAVGGSLGARSINTALDGIIEKLLEDGLQLIWQTGTSYTGGERREKNLYRATFIHEIEKGYAAADLVLARAGAMTIAELAAMGKPSLLVPLPTAADDHQRVNAETAQQAEAARMLLDIELESKLYPTLQALLADSENLAAMSHAVAAMAVPDADEKIAQNIIGLAMKR